MGESTLWPHLPPTELAIDDGVRTRSRQEVDERVARVARLLREGMGLAPGDHAAMLMSNRVEFVELILGAAMAGVHITPINWHLTTPEVRYILDDAGAAVLFADDVHAAVASEAASGSSVPLILAGDDLESALGDHAPVPYGPDEPSGHAMLYTSGTTGRPKGVARITPETVIEARDRSRAVAKALGLDCGGPHLVTGPLYHSAPLGFSMPPFHAGSPLVLMDQWSPEGMLAAVADRGVTSMHMVPIMFVRCLRLSDDAKRAFDPSSLRVVIHGAAPVSPAVKAAMIEWWGEVLLEYWGSTEGGVFTLVSSHDWLTKPGTVGRAVPTYEVFAVGDDRARLPAGETGTLYTRNLITKDVFEYHQDDAKTDAAHLEPGVFTMGDVGWVDGDGYVFLSDRAADMVISGGVNIYPVEIEQVIIEHPAVHDVAVFGIPDPEWGESVKAAVELLDGEQPSPELERSILAFARERLAGFKVPRSIDFEDHLPRHPTGKLYKRLLRDPYWSGRDTLI